jgi:nitric oxide reductase large subunit
VNIAAISVIIGWIFGIGVVVGAIGAVAIVGYIINAPNLYYYIEGVNSAIACHTAALFMVLGIGFICL